MGSVQRSGIQAGLPRALYTIMYWGVIAVVAYEHRSFLIQDLPQISESKLGMFSEVGLAVGGLMALVLLVYVQEAIANTIMSVWLRMTGGQSVNYEGANYQKNLLKSARRLDRKGDYIGAAEAYEALELWAEAGECYAKAAAFSRGATAFEKAGMHEQAIQLLEKDGNYEAAGELAQREGMRERAIENFRQAAAKALETNSYLKAAALYERAFEFVKAGEIWERMNRDLDAIRSFQQARKVDKIVSIIERVDLEALAANNDSAAQILGRAADLLVRSGHEAHAARVLELSGQLLLAAEAYEKAGDWARAGEAYLKAELPDKARAAFANLGDTRQVADFQARVAMQRGNLIEAGRYYEEAEKYNQAVDCYKKAKDYLSAAKAYEKLGRPLMAAEMYSTAREFKAAASAYAQAHDWRSAAECYEAVGDLAQAIGAWANAGNFFKAGSLALKQGDTSRAIEYLQRVPMTSPDSAAANAFLAVAFYDHGRVGAARDLFSKAVHTLPPVAEYLPVFYRYGRLMEESDLDAAMWAYRQVLTIDIKYEDAEYRLRNLENTKHRSEETSSETPTRPTSRLSTRALTPPPTVPTRDSTTGARVLARESITQAPDTRFGAGGRYTIQNELGRGGMAIVYKAFDEHLQREVALKTFPMPRLGARHVEEAFLREARLVARLSHPNIVTIFDCGHMDNLYYIAMEFVAGENLKQVVRRKGPMSLEDVRLVTRQLCEALMYAHSQSVLHLDIKPGNVILRQSGGVKVVDFGLARILSEAAANAGLREDSQPTLVGTPQYMAPEQIMGTEVDCRTDIYSLGMTLYYLLTGRTPFDVKKITDPVEIARMQVHASFPRPSTLRATLPPKFDEVFARCTQKSPSDRYPSVQALLDDLFGV